MLFTLAVVLVAGAAVLAPGGTVSAQDRVALVVGNGAYQHASRLLNPSNDAGDMTAALRALNFTVVTATDVDKAAFDQKLREFARALRGARTAVFLYAGHGIQVAGRNYAIPVDAKLETAGDLAVETVDIDQIVSVMQADEGRVNLVFLDACRDNPLTRSFARNLPATRAASVGSGLSAVEAGRGTLIAFSTAPNKVALDGSGRNSPFTQALLKHIRTPGLDIAFVMRRVTADVESSSGGRQVPWMHASLTSDVVLAAGNVGASVPAPAPPAPPPGPAADEIAWNFLKDTKDPEQLQRFIDQFPASRRRADAAARLVALKDEAERAKQAARPAAIPPSNTGLSSSGRKLAALGAGRELLAQYRDWRAITATAGGQKYCYALGEPIQSESSPSSTTRKATFLMVRTYQGSGLHEVSLTIGYKFKNKDAATMQIGSATFPLHTEDDNGWIKNLSDETRIVESMRSASRLVIKGSAASGMTTTDHYSLVGLAEAIDRAAQECR